MESIQLMVWPKDFLLHPDIIKMGLDKAYFVSAGNMNQVEGGAD